MRQRDSGSIANHSFPGCISPSVMLPANRLAVLLQTIKQSQIDTCLFHTASSSPSLYSDHSCPRERFPTEVALELIDLGGEAWQVQYSPDGSMLAGCGSDRVVIWDENYEVLVKLEGHEHGVGSIAWSPDGSMLVTCSQDKTARLWSIPVGVSQPQKRTNALTVGRTASV